jgi:hypothetical protein
VSVTATAPHTCASKKLRVLEKENHLTDDVRLLSPVNQIVEQLRSGTLTDREQLLKFFTMTKKKLDKIGKNLAFLSITMMDLTGIKVREEKATVEHGFREYKRFVEAQLQSHGCIKTVWTPDGTVVLPT